MRWRRRNILTLACTVTGLLAGSPTVVPAQSREVLGDFLRSLETVRPSVLAGHVSFLSSDHLFGRSFASPGELISADYIASQFRSIELETVGDNEYFQTIHLLRGSASQEGWRLVFDLDGKVLEIPAAEASPGADPLHLAEVPVVKVFSEQLARSSADGLEVDGKAVLTLGGFALTSRVLSEMSDLRRALREVIPDQERTRMERELGELEQTAKGINDLRLDFLAAIKEKGALIHFDVSEDVQSTAGRWRRTRIWDPTDKWMEGLGKAPDWTPGIRSVRIYSEKAFSLFEPVPKGSTPATVSLSLSAPVGEPVEARNVVGLIPGSDPELSDTYVLVTAHFDGQGSWSGYAGDSILNSANDNGTGTAAVIEIARVLSEYSESPRRSVLFVAFSGEEEGLLGSGFFVSHPLVPLEKIAAVVNLEMLGRTDDSFEGPQIKSFSITGFDYSTMHEAFERAGERVGVEVREHAVSDDYFGRSDNATFADVGIPAHTLSATYSYPDYHGPEDVWERNDYQNMALLTRAAALGIWLLANDAEPPKWNSADSVVEQYERAWRRLHGIGS